MSNSKNSFRIDDILSGVGPLKPTKVTENNVQAVPAKKRPFNGLDSNSSILRSLESRKMPYQSAFVESQLEQQNDLQRALQTLFQHSEQTQNMNNFLVNLLKNPQLTQPVVQQPQQHQFNPEAYFNEYYMRLFGSRYSQDFVSNSAHDMEQAEPSAKRFKPASLAVPSTYLPQQQKPNKPQYEQQRLSSEMPAYGSNSLSNSNSSSSSEVLNTSPRSLLSNSESESASSVNSTENVSPLDALLHLANSTFTGHFQRSAQQGHEGSIEPSQQQQALILNNIYKLKKHAMYVNDENNGLLGN
jgi:hypothetical protein